MGHHIYLLLVDFLAFVKLDILLIEVFKSPDLKNLNKNIISKVGPGSLKLVGSNFFTIFLMFTKWPYLSHNGQNEKSEGTLSYQTFKVETGKVTLLFSVLTIMTDKCSFWYGSFHN